jgi:hypothetical protein
MRTFIYASLQDAEVDGEDADKSQLRGDLRPFR